MPFEFRDPLPDTLSGLLELALSDLRVIEGGSKWRVDMDDWLNLQACSVCMAGAVMVQHCDLSQFNGLGLVCVTPSMFSAEDCKKLRAINELRTGCIANAMSCLRPGLSRYSISECLNGCPAMVSPWEYSDKNYAEWREDMQKLLDLLRKHDL